MVTVCLTYEMGFFRKIADCVTVMDQGQIIEENAQTKIF